MEDKENEMEEKNSMSLKEAVGALRKWAESHGKKPRQWAKIPVGTLHELCNMVESAASADMQGVCDKARGWQDETARLRRLLGRVVPFLEGTMAIVRRSCELAKKSGGRAGMEMLLEAENQSRELSQVLGDVRAEAQKEDA